ncbi:MAG: aminopeptidase [Adhaeribacter sp.]
MNIKLIFSGLLLAGSLQLAAQTPNISTEALVNRIVNTVSKVNAGETIILKGDKDQLNLLESLGEQIHKKGAFPVIMLESEKLTKAGTLSVPEEALVAHHKALHKLDNKADLTIYIANNIDYANIYKQAPEAYAEKRRNAIKEYHNGAPENMASFREVYIGLPNKKMAEAEGIAYNTYEKMIMEAMAVDNEAIAAKGKQIAAILQAGKKVKVTTANGTDFTFMLAGRPTSIDDGIISEADLKSSVESDRMVALPTGLLLITGDESSGSGKIVAARDRQFGNQGPVKITSAVYQFQDGKLGSVKATTNQAFLEKRLKEAQPNATQFGGLVIGLNPAMKVLSDEKQDFRPYEAEGMVFIHIGGNDWMGGKNKVKEGTTIPVEKATVAVDGKIIIKDGKLVTNSVASK